MEGVILLELEIVPTFIRINLEVVVGKSNLTGIVCTDQIFYLFIRLQRISEDPFVQERIVFFLFTE